MNEWNSSSVDKFIVLLDMKFWQSAYNTMTAGFSLSLTKDDATFLISWSSVGCFRHFDNKENYCFNVTKTENC